MQKLYIMSRINYTVKDPPLTRKGLEIECHDLSQHLEKHVPLIQQVELIVTSPLKRTLQTTEAALDFLIKRGIPVIPLAELQETTENPIDIGSPLAELKQAWPHYDWSKIDPIFPSKEGIYKFSQDTLLQRGAMARKWLANRHEKVIAVVSHASFLRIGLGNCKFANADFRIFELEETGDSAMKGPTMVEWESTKAMGGGMGRSVVGFYGWEVHDFGYMPGNEGKTREGLEKMVLEAPLR
ncbi:hypothetical protein HYFRA_00002609 [Hymenoscyphus fraxineus]|uniref:Phosphoglycerate mutase-like protein n=1 Tax=Hymenoscyphus fraxineus TaxID=746836 RepID=A0A9N9LBG5_9HELO|nr:hypothetical protein HYFRA_00002609 [Hymenoscyphus fraxineus]